MKNVLSLLAFLIFSVTVVSAQQLTADNNLFGTYTGKFPCKNCAFTMNILTIQEGQVASLIWSNHSENSESSKADAFVEQGKWSVEGNIMTIVYNGKTLKYMLGQNTLTLIGDNGKQISSDEASKYVLSK